MIAIRARRAEPRDTHAIARIYCGAADRRTARSEDYNEGIADRVGFREVGTYRRHAKLNGLWRDTVIVERLLGEAAR